MRIISQNSLLICCAPHIGNHSYYQIPFEDFSEGLRQWQIHCDELLGNIMNNKPTGCMSCVNLKKGLYEINPEVHTILLGCGFDEDLCNFRCCYCNVHSPMQIDTYGKPFNIMWMLREIDMLYGSKHLTLMFANGEITARCDCDEILRFCLDKPWSFSFITNASIYRESITDLLRAGKRVSMIVSLDAGTNETYVKIKNAGCFNTTAKNLERYSGAGAVITLKYIVLDGINDNEADIDGFTALAERLGTPVVMSCNQRNLKKQLSENALCMAFRLIDNCKKHKINITVTPENFHRQDLKVIEEQLHK